MSDLDEAIDLFARAALVSSDGHSQNLALGLKALAKHLRNSPADGKAERGDGAEPSTLYKIYNDAYQQAVHDFQHPGFGFDNLADTRRHAGYLALYEAGQQSRLDKRERAVLVAAKRWLEHELRYRPDDRGWDFAGEAELAAAVKALDSAAKSDANPSK